MEQIPFVDLKAQYLSIKSEIDEAISGVIRDTSFVGGAYVKKFEESFARHMGAKHVMSCGNGTDSLEILLSVTGIGPGDEVIVPAISWISTSEAVTAVGARPVFADIDPEFYTIRPDAIREKINAKTKAIIPVHLYGQPADMPAIMDLAKKHNLTVIEDCAQSHDASIAGVTTGLWGHASSFSFYPGKNLGAYGDAGCMLTNDDAVAAKARMIANHGQVKKHDHQVEGRNSRLDSMQASILSAKLPHLNAWTESRIRNAARFTQLLSASLPTPRIRPDARHVFHLYVVQVENRARVMDALKKLGVETAIHYPTALPFLPAYKRFGHLPKEFPVAAACQDSVLSLPFYPELDESKIEYIASHLLKVTGHS